MICIIDYGMGNLRSVSKALEKLGASVQITSNPADLDRAEKIVLPGVGAFGDGCQELEKRGFFKPLQRILASSERPFLGICLGMQLLFEESEESPGIQGLGVFPGQVQRFRNSTAKIPHMGWNQMKILISNSEILKEIPDMSYFYFVHSFYPVPRDPSLVLGICDYAGENFAAFVGRGRVWGSQFHPEKSQEAGLRILENFVKL